MAAQMKLKPLLAIILAFSLSLLSACGFHLRGALNVSEAKQQLSLQSEKANINLQQSLNNVLRENNISVTTDASYHLNIIKSRYQRESVSLDRSARVNEYSLTLTVDFELQSLKNELSERQTAIVERTYSYDADAAAAQDEQESLLRQEMYDSMANRIIRRYLAFDRAK